MRADIAGPTPGSFSNSDAPARLRCTTPSPGFLNLLPLELLPLFFAGLPVRFALPADAVRLLLAELDGVETGAGIAWGSSPVSSPASSATGAGLPKTRP